MSDYVDLIAEQPVDGKFMLLHSDQTVDLYLSVQLAVVDSSHSVWDTAVWDTDVWEDDSGGFSWMDLTGLVRGLSLTRGSTGLADRAETGTCNVTLDWAGGYLDLFDNSIFPFPLFLRSGSLWRIAVTAGAPWTGVYDWSPLFTGVAESLTERSSSQWADGWVDLVLVETSSLAAQHDDPAVSVRGYGDTLEERLNRVLGIDPPRSKPWLFGLNGDLAEGMAAYVEFQSTDLAASMLTEAYRTADTVHYEIYSDRSGALHAVETSGTLDDWTAGARTVKLHPYPEYVESDVTHIPYDTTDGVGIELNSDDVANIVLASAVGGTEQQAADGVSISLYGQIATGRDDLLMTDLSAHVQDWCAIELAMRKDATLHFGPVSLDAAMGTSIGEALAALDIRKVVEVSVPNRVPMSFSIAGYTMDIQPLDDWGNCVWKAEIALRPA